MKSHNPVTTAVNSFPVSNMELRKQQFMPGEIPIFDAAVIYMRGDYWQFRMWLKGEGKYARKSLNTRSESTAVERGKAAYLEIYNNAQQGRTYFSITTKQGVALFIQHRQKDVDAGRIVSGRLGTIQTHLQHWLKFIGANTKLKELDRTDCADYQNFRIKAGTKRTTISNEQSTINALMRWLFRQQETPIDGFDFPALPKLDRQDDSIRRATLTGTEWRNIFVYMRRYCSPAECSDSEQRMLRQLVRHWILIAANSGLRTGEQRQLRWSDVAVEGQQLNGKTIQLARIRVRAETSKVRQSRTFLCRGGDCLVRMRRLWPNRPPSALVFSLDGEKQLSERNLLEQFYAILTAAGITDFAQRQIVPYSLRHFMITQRVMAGLSYEQIAEMCGTSALHVANTYYHVNDQMRLTSALADFAHNADGTIRTTTLWDRTKPAPPTPALDLLEVEWQDEQPDDEDLD